MDYASSFSPNPSSIHELGIKAKKDLENARVKVSQFLGAHRSEIIFTSGGTESNNLAIQGVLYSAAAQAFFRSSGRPSGSARPFKKLVLLPHFITTNIEHPSVLDTCRLLQERGLAEISVIPVEPNGIVDPKKIRKELKENTVLISVMYANNEIGTIQPIREIAKEIRHFRKMKNLIRLEHPPLAKEKVGERCIYPFLHTDAVQAVNYLDLNVEKLGVDFLSLSGTKVKGGGQTGVLYKKRIVSLSKIFGGGDQEFGLCPGTENLPEIIKFSKALEKISKLREKENKRLSVLQKYFFKKLQKFGAIINGDIEKRLPNNINATFPSIPSDLLVLELSAKGIMVSSKSACKSSSKEGSYVIEALWPGSDPEISGVRFSMGRSTTKKEIDETVKALSQILKKLGKWYN